MARLYHFTDLLALVGADGLAAMKSHGGDCEGSDFAAPGSILADGIRPAKTTDYDRMFRSPLPPCVWLTANPDMLDGCSSHTGFRITMAIPSGRRLVLWPEYFRKAAGCDLRDHLSSELMRREAARFFVYFGVIMPDRIRAIDQVAPPA